MNVEFFGEIVRSLITSILICLSIFFINWENKKKWYLYVSLIFLFLGIIIVMLLLLNYLDGIMMLIPNTCK